MSYKIAQTKTTPYAEFNSGCLVIRGKSFPLDRPEVFDTIQDRLLIYFQNPEKHFCIDFYLSVLNGISKRFIINTFKLLEQLIEKDSDLEINWFYQFDNTDIKEFGEICKSFFKLNIVVKIGV